MVGYAVDFKSGWLQKLKPPKTSKIKNGNVPYRPALKVQCDDLLETFALSFYPKDVTSTVPVRGGWQLRDTARG